MRTIHKELLNEARLREIEVNRESGLTLLTFGAQVSVPLSLGF
jgi:hypothetical protein